MDKINFWNNIYLDNSKFSSVSEILLDELNLSGSAALDIGCGTGDLLLQLKERGFEITGIDLSDVAIKKAKSILGTTELWALDFFEYKPNKKFDLIFINKVLAFTDKKKDFINKALSALNRNGKLIVITPIIFDKYSRKYSVKMNSISINEKELEQILPSNFKVFSKRLFDVYGCEYTIVIEK